MKRLIIVIIILVAAFFALDFAIDRAMMHGIKNYYGLNQKPDILLLGHSHLMLATDKQRMEKELGMRVSKYCREGVSVADKKVMAEHFINSGLADSLKYVLYGVDLYSFTVGGLSNNAYKLFYPFMDDADVNDYIHREASATDYWLHKIVRTSRYNNDGVKNGAARGWMNNWDNLKTNTIDVEQYKKEIAGDGEQKIEMNPKLIQSLKETVDMFTSKGITVILVNAPTLNLLNEYEPDMYNRMVTWYKNYSRSNALVMYWDYNPRYSADYSLFSDKLHLNVKGQEIITTNLVKDLDSLNNITKPI